MSRQAQAQAKARKQRRAEHVGHAIFWLGWATWPAGAYFAAGDIAQQFVIGLSELALIYTAWTALQVVDPEVG